MLISLYLCLPLPFLPPSHADCFCTENSLRRYSAWPIYHIDQFIKKLDVHRRLPKNVPTRKNRDFFAPSERADMVILPTWPCDI